MEPTHWHPHFTRMSRNLVWLLKRTNTIYYIMYDFHRSVNGQAAAERFAATSCYITAHRVLEDLGVELGEPLGAAPSLPTGDDPPVVLAFGGESDGDGLDQHEHVMVLHAGQCIQSFFKRMEETRHPIDAALLARVDELDVQRVLVGLPDDDWPITRAATFYATRPRPPASSGGGTPDSPCPIE